MVQRTADEIWDATLALANELQIVVVSGDIRPWESALYLLVEKDACRLRRPLFELLGLLIIEVEDYL